jgi:hypothetical protein
VQDPSVKVPTVTYLPEDQVSVPQDELTAAHEEGKSLLQQSFTLLKAKFEGPGKPWSIHRRWCMYSDGAVCVHWWLNAIVCLDGGIVWFTAK